MKQKTKNAVILFIILFIMAAAVIGVSCFVENLQTVPKTEASIKENQNIFPVLYYEQRSVFRKIGTHTFLLTGDEVLKLESHGRTFSRTAPASARANLSVNDPSAKTLGQLMAYYNTPDGEIFFFDSYNEPLYTIIKGDDRITIPQEQNQSYHEFLRFGENYYLFTHIFAENEIIRIYRLSENLEKEKTFDIDYIKQNLDHTAFANCSFAVIGDNLLVMSQNRLLRYNMENGETKYLRVGCNLKGIIAGEDGFYTVGTKENGNYVFQIFDREGNFIRSIEKSLPFGFGYAPDTFSSGTYYYMYGSEIYFDFDRNGICYVVSFDIESGEWTNYWVAEKNVPTIGRINYKFGNVYSPTPSNVKFVISENGSYYDLYPYWNNNE